MGRGNITVSASANIRKSEFVSNKGKKTVARQRRKELLQLLRAKRRRLRSPATGERMSPSDSLSAVVGGTSVMQGWLRKRGKYHHISSHWNERYFILNDKTLSYYVRRGDFEPKGEFLLYPECKVSEIVVEGKDIKNQPQRNNGETKRPARGSEKKQKRNQIDGQDLTPNASNANERKDGKKGHYYTFRVTWPSTIENEPASDEADAPPSTPASLPQHTRSGDNQEEIPLLVLAQTESVGESILMRTLFKSNMDDPVRDTSSRKYLMNENTEKFRNDFEPMSPPLSPISLRRSCSGRSSSTIRKSAKSKTIPPSPPREMQQLMLKNTPNSLHMLDEPEKIIAALEAVKKARSKKMHRKMVKSGGLVAATGAIVTTSVLTGGLSLATLLTVIGISAAAGTSGAVASRTFLRCTKQMGWTLVLAAMTPEDAHRWRSAIIEAIGSDSDDDTISEHVDEHELDAPVSVGTWANLFALGGHNPASVFIPNVASLTSDDGSSLGLHLSSAYAQSGTSWKPVISGWASFLGMGSTGLRIFEEEESPFDIGTKAPFEGDNFNQMISVKGRSSPLLKAQIVLDANPVDAFMCLMSYNQVRSRTDTALAPVSSQWSSFRIVESLDDQTDIIHLVFRPLFLFPSWTSPRDFCIVRYWRLDDDGCYVMFYEPVKHRECPPNPSYVRGEMHGVYTIAPLKEGGARSSGDKRHLRCNDESSQCMLMHMVQTDPKGWVPTFKVPFLASQRYTDAFGVSSLLQILDVRDALASERFVSVSVGEDHGNLNGKDKKLMKSISTADLNLNGSNIELGVHSDYYVNLARSESTDESIDRRNYDFTFSKRELFTSPSGTFFPILSSDHERRAEVLISGKGHQQLPDFLPASVSAEPDANSFMVRGEHYLTDRKKVNAGESIMRLMGVDIVEVAIPETKGLCAHPKEWVQAALQREKMGGPKAPLFIFVMNILLPGPPHYHMLIYYSVEDMSTIDGSSGTPSSILANKFFFGESDAFRDNTFKLIPQIVEGNFIVRKAVGSTPAIMGTKLKQYYFSSDRYFELFLDVASSSVAAGVTRLTAGYAKTVVVDLAFLLEGSDESTLPEKILGSCRLKNVDFGSGMRFCEPY